MEYVLQKFIVIESFYYDDIKTKNFDLIIFYVNTTKMVGIQFFKMCE